MRPRGPGRPPSRFEWSWYASLTFLWSIPDTSPVLTSDCATGPCRSRNGEGRTMPLTGNPSAARSGSQGPEAHRRAVGHRARAPDVRLSIEGTVPGLTASASMFPATPSGRHPALTASPDLSAASGYLAEGREVPRSPEQGRRPRSASSTADTTAVEAHHVRKGAHLKGRRPTSLSRMPTDCNIEYRPRATVSFVGGAPDGRRLLHLARLETTIGLTGKNALASEKALAGPVPRT